MNEDALNKEVKAWVKSTEKDLKAQAKKLGIEHRDNSPSASSSVKAITGKTSTKFRVVSKITFKFPRHMVFVHKGVGRGTTAAQAGTTNRKAKEWFEPVTDKNIDRLADIVADNTGDSIVARLHF